MLPVFESYISGFLGEDSMLFSFDRKGMEEKGKGERG